MSWLFSQELVAGFSGEESSVGEPCAPSKSIPTAAEYYAIDRMTELSGRSQFGTTSKRLMVDRGAALLTSFRAASHVRTLAHQEKEKASPETKADSGPKWRGLSARFDHGSSTWKTHLCLFPEVLPESSVTLPKWGMMRNGELWERITSVPRIGETGSGSSAMWQTPTADESGGLRAGHWNSRFEPKLSAQVLLPTPTASAYGTNQSTSSGSQVRPSLQTMARHDLWPTPIVTGNYNRADLSKKAGNGLATAVKEAEPQMFPTPTATMAKGALPSRYRGSENYRRNLHEYVRTSEQCGQLNPDWVDWLMGFPVGYTGCGRLETPRFRKWLSQHFES